MNQHAADKLFNELTAAEIAHILLGTPVDEFLRRRANKHNGEVKKHLLRISSLGADASIFLDYFIEGMEDG